MNNITKHIFSKSGFFWLIYYFVNATPLKRLLSDKHYLSLQYRCLVGKKLNLDQPRSFNEKLQWLKLYDRNPLYPKMVDKYEAKLYVSSIIGEEYIIPTLAVFNSIEEIDWDTLPQQFVLKCTHDSGGIVVCRNRDDLNVKSAIRKLKTSLKNNFYYSSREWPYKNVIPRIILEKYMENQSGELIDYKFYCFNGEPKVLSIASDRLDPTVDTKFDFFDMDFNHLPFSRGHAFANTPVPKPQSFEHMKTIAQKLSSGIPHVRVDLYEINGKVYFGELTFYTAGGMTPFKPVEWDYIFGEWLALPNSKQI